MSPLGNKKNHRKTVRLPFTLCSNVMEFFFYSGNLQHNV